MRKKGEVVTEEATPVEGAMPTEVAKAYTGAPFYLGQRVTIIKELDINKILENFDNDKQKKTITEKLTLFNEKVAKFELSGIIVDINEDYETKDNLLTLNLGEIYQFTSSIHPFSLIFPEERTFFVIKQSCCGYIKEEDDGLDTETKSFVSFLSTTTNSTMEKRCESVIKNKEEIDRKFKDISNYKSALNESIKRHQEIQIVNNALIDMIKAEIQEVRNGKEDFHAYYKNIFKNKNVKSVEIVNFEGQDCVLLTTNELDYEDTNNHLAIKNPMNVAVAHPQFNIGGYKVLFFRDGRAIAANYTRFVGTGQHHPCVSSETAICMGAEFQKALRDVIAANDFASAIHYTIDFLKNPNSNNPYLDSVNFYLTQERKWTPENQLDYFYNSSKYNETWDENLYKKQVEELKKTLK